MSGDFKPSVFGRVVLANRTFAARTQAVEAAICGWSSAYQSQLETGRRGITEATLSRLATAHGDTLEDYMERGLRLLRAAREGR